MPRTPALAVLALLAVVAVGVGTAGAVATDRVADGNADAPTVDDGFPAVTTVPNTTNYLSTGSTDRASYVRSDVDVAAAAGMSAQQLHARHDRGAFDARFEAAGSESDRVDLVRETADSTESRIDRLDARHEALLAAYSNGTLSRETTIRRLARLSVAAGTARANLQHVADRVDSTPGTSVPVALETRLSDLQTALVTLPDPVVDRVKAGLAGERDPVVVYAGGTGNGLVLATVDGGEFVRTATARDDYAPGQPDQFERGEDRAVILALQRGGELYPWAYENDIGGPQIRGFGNTGVYLISVDYAHGELQTYLSGVTTDAFYEIQIQDPEGVPTTDTASTAADSLNVTVETTTASGPTRVRLIQPSTNAPLNGTVLIDGRPVGETGDDGELWTVQPAGQFRVNATTGANSAEVTVSG
jgi:hypothetical protein